MISMECLTLLLFNKEDKAKWDRFWLKNGFKSPMMVSLLTRSYHVHAVTVTIKSRVVTVKGARGTVTKDLSHMSVEMQKMKQADKKRKGNFIRLRMWFGAYKQAAQVKTVKSIINNMMSGVVEVSHFHLICLTGSKWFSVWSFSFLSACQFN